MVGGSQVIGDGLAFVVSILRGRGFPENVKKFIVKGSINKLSEDGANIKEIVVDSQKPDHFGIDLEWIFTEEDFTLCRNLSSNVVIQVFYFDSFDVGLDARKEPIGVLTFPLDKAVELSSSKNDTMREDLSEWVKLERSDDDVELLCSFTIAKCDDEVNESNVFASVNEETAQIQPPLPNLLADKGYFLLGDEETTTDLYYFNVFLAGVKDLSNELAPDVFFFSYHLFGIKITTDEFATKEDYRSEQASVKIRSNVGNIVTFFSETIKDSPFRVYLNSNAIGGKIGQAEADWPQMLFKDVNKSKEKLQKGERVSYNGVLPIRKLPEPEKNIGKVFVRFSLDIKPDLGLDETMDASDSLARETSVADESFSISGQLSVPEVEINQTLSSMSVNSNSPPKFNESVVTRPILPNPTGVQEPYQDSEQNLFKESIKTQAVVEKSLEESDVEKSYNFIFHVMSVGAVANESKNVTCSIVCVDSPFRLQKQNSFPITTSTSMNNIRLFTVPDIFYNISFKSKPSKVEKVFGQKYIILQVSLNGSLLGKATIPLAQYAENLSQETTADVNIISRTRSAVGVISCRCSLIPTANEVVANITTATLTMAERDTVREHEEELRQWKQKEKKLFLEELKNIKSSQLKELSQEWKKQEMEFRKYQEARKNDLVEAEKSLLDLVKKYREHEQKLSEKENQKKEEWRKRESMESLALRESEAQLKKKDLEIARLKSENKALKAENQLLKEANESWKKRLAFPLNQNAETFRSDDILQLPKTQRNFPSTASSVDTSEGPKTPNEKNLLDVKSRLLKTSVYREGDPLIEFLTEEMSHGAKKMT